MRTEEQIMKAVEATLGSSCDIKREKDGFKVLTRTRVTEQQGNEIVERLGSPGGYWGAFFTLNPPEQGLFLKYE